MQGTGGLARACRASGLGKGLWRLTPLLSALAFVPSLLAQYEVAPAERQHFDRTMADSSLKQVHCTVNYWPPRLDFAFRFQAGYLVRFPVSQYEGENNQIHILTRIAPQEGPAVPLVQQFVLPKVPRSNPTWLAVEGAYLLGAGKYKVDLLFTDSSGRGCRAHWKFETPRRPENDRITLSLAPGAVQPLNIRRWDEVRSPEPAGAKLAIFLDATPINPSASQLRPFDRVLLLNSLVSLLAKARYRDVSLVAFNLDQQKVLLEAQHLDEQGYLSLANKLRDLQLATIDYEVLKRRRGHIEMLARLLNTELAAEDPPDAVVFLGPASSLRDRFPPELIQHGSAAMPHVFYFEYHPYWGRGPEFADVLRNLTKACSGKAFSIHSPAELSNAIEIFARSLAAASYDPDRPASLTPVAATR
jgi:hypothetical protein